MKRLAFLVCLGLIALSGIGRAEPIPDFERLADAIYKAEGGARTAHPYGILTKYKTTTPRQACLNTVRNQWKRHAGHACGKDYWTCLRDRYCPIGAENDPTGLNVNWLRNVLHHYLKR